MRDKLPLHGGQLQHIADRFGIPASSLLDFSANINPDGPPATVHFALRDALSEPSVLTTYPELGETALRKSIAAYTGVEPGNIAVANGFVPLLDATLRARSIRKCLVPVPAFIEYRRTLEHASVQVITEKLSPESGFRYHLDSLLNGSHDAILLANPQNPTGILHDREILLDLIQRAAEQNILILLDEAFIDYCSEASLVGNPECYRNLIVFRSVTKFFGMPGLRVAYAVSCEKTTSQLQDRVAPWSITTLASRAAAAALKDEDYFKNTRTLNEKRRNELSRALNQLALQAQPSAANFLLFRLPSDVNVARFWERLITQHRIVLRLCSDYEGLPDGCLRAAVRNDSENCDLARALKQTLMSFAARSEIKLRQSTDQVHACSREIQQ